MTASACPSPQMLSALADHQLTPDEALAVHTHLAACARCREELLDWLAVEEAIEAADCPSPEILVAYAENALADTERIGATAHLAVCARCRTEIESIRAMAEAEPSVVIASAPSWRERIAAFARALSRPGPVLSAATAAALLIIALARLLPTSGYRAPLATENLAVDERRQGEASAEPQKMARGLQDTLSLDQPREDDIGRLKREPYPGSSQPSAPRAAAPAPMAPPAQAPPAPAGRSQAALEGPAQKRLRAAPATGGGAETKPEARDEVERVYKDTLSGAAPLRGMAPQAEATQGLLAARARPSEDSPIVAKVRPEDLVARVKDENGWTLVALSIRRLAWVRSADVPANLPEYQPPAALRGRE